MVGSLGLDLGVDLSLRQLRVRALLPFCRWCFGFDGGCGLISFGLRWGWCAVGFSDHWQRPLAVTAAVTTGGDHHRPPLAASLPLCAVVALTDSLLAQTASYCHGGPLLACIRIMLHHVAFPCRSTLGWSVLHFSRAFKK